MNHHKSLRKLMKNTYKNPLLARIHCMFWKGRYLDQEQRISKEWMQELVQVVWAKSSSSTSKTPIFNLSMKDEVGSGVYIANFCEYVSNNNGSLYSDENSGSNCFESTYIMLYSLYKGIRHYFERLIKISWT